MLKFIILTSLFAPSIRAALTSQDMASALIAADDTGTLEKTFKTFEKEQRAYELAEALAYVAKQARMPKAVHCLRMALDPFPEDEMRVSYLMHGALVGISDTTDTESFTNMITSFKPSDVKPLVAIRYMTLRRNDVVYVLKSVMSKSPELIIDDLPSWIAFHTLDRISANYSPVLEKAFQYLTSFATEDVLAKALAILKRNEHYKVIFGDYCCNSQDRFSQDLSDKLNVLLELVKARRALVNELAILPKVLVDLMLEYAACDIPPNCSKATPEASVSVLGKRSSPLQSSTLHKKSKRGQ